MRTPVLVPGVFLLSAAIWQQTRAPDCCPTKTVKDASEEDSHLNGVYTLKAKMDSKPSPECVDGCVYMRDNQEYCFIEKPGATAVCEVSTLSFTALASLEVISDFLFMVLRHFFCGNVCLFNPFLFLGSHLALLY